MLRDLVRRKTRSLSGSIRGASKRNMLLDLLAVSRSASVAPTTWKDLCDAKVASLLLVAIPGAPNSVLVTSSFWLLVR